MLTLRPAVDPARLFLPFDLAPRRTVIAAVSGGSDSTALLFLLKLHLDASSPTTRLVAATVDHALRPESAAEAVAVGQLCARLGVAHRILAWTGEKPTSGIAAAAREARHALLAEAARAEGADLVLTGHTMDDQAETVLMREAREDGRGLAGIAPATLFDGEIWFGRPLLSLRREALRAFLRARGEGWIDDPTNANQRYERPRLRKALAHAGGEEAIAQALEVAAESRRRREALGREAAGLMLAHVDRPAPGLLRLEPALLRATEREAAVYALRILLAVAGGAAHLPDAARTIALYEQLAGGGAFRTALSRALVDRRKTGAFLLREARGLPATVEEGRIWDGRYRVVRRPLSGDRALPSARTRPDAAQPPGSLVDAAAAAEPKLAARLEAVPVLAPWARYLPSFDIAPARAAAALIGAAEVPDAPFHEHIESKA